MGSPSSGSPWNAPSARRRRSAKVGLEVGGDQLCLGDEACGACAPDETFGRRSCIARGEHDAGSSIAGAREVRGEGNSVAVGEVDIQEHGIRVEARDGQPSFGQAAGLAGDLVTACIQYRADRATKGWVVVDDEHTDGHGNSLDCARGRGNGAYPRSGERYGSLTR